MSVMRYSGSSQRRVSASVTALTPVSRCFLISFCTSFSFSAAPTFSDFAVKALSLSARAGHIW